MTDRELLEAAARAAGYGVPWMSTMYEYYFVVIDGQSVPWNPLTDNADAFRLAVKLRMTVDHGEDWAVALLAKRDEICEEVADHSDIYAATRRAIVRAAAAMGGRG